MYIDNFDDFLCVLIDLLVAVAVIFLFNFVLLRLLRELVLVFTDHELEIGVGLFFGLL